MVTLFISIFLHVWHFDIFTWLTYLHFGCLHVCIFFAILIHLTWWSISFVNVLAFKPLGFRVHEPLVVVMICLTFHTFDLGRLQQKPFSRAVFRFVVDHTCFNVSHLCIYFVFSMCALSFFQALLQLFTSIRFERFRIFWIVRVIHLTPFPLSHFGDFKSERKTKYYPSLIPGTTFGPPLCVFE